MTILPGDIPVNNPITADRRITTHGSSSANILFSMNFVRSFSGIVGNFVRAG